MHMLNVGQVQADCAKSVRNPVFDKGGLKSPDNAQISLGDVSVQPPRVPYSAIKAFQAGS